MGRVRVAKILKRTTKKLMESKTLLLSKKVKERSSATYSSHLRTMTRILARLRGTRTADILTISKDELIELLVNLEEQGVASAPGFLSALKQHALEKSVSIPHLDDPAVIAGAKAVKRAAKQKSKPCGTITEQQFEELKTYLRDRQEDELLYAVVVAFRARLRIGELYGLRLDDVLLEEGFVFLRLRECKQNRDGSDINPDPKIVPASLRSAMKACAARGFGSEGRLFGADIDGRLRRGLPIWAAALNWSDSMRWSGPHIFRHGGTQVLDALAGSIGRVVLSIVSQQTTGTFAHYAKTAEQRAKKL